MTTHDLNRDNHSDIVDIGGIGFGPSNLGLAIALSELNDQLTTPLTARFVERQAKFGWHRGMLLPRTTMQISFLKDLATQRNAQSRYTFINYLAEKGRLTDFINHQTFFPTRHEFHDYLEWAAQTVDADVMYGTEAVDVAVEGDHFVVQLAGGHRGILRARNLIVSTGLTTRLPHGISASRRVFHNHRLLTHLTELPPLEHGRLLVLGAGQSAAEVVEYLHTRYPEAAVHSVFSKYGYTPADDSPYANRIFDPSAVDDFHASTPEFRHRLLGYHRATNYSAVDLPLIQELYAREYAERVSGDRRLFMHGASRVVEVDQAIDHVAVTISHEPTGLTETLVCDAVVCATGFDQMSLGATLGELADEIVYDAEGPRVSRGYRVMTTAPLPGGIYLQGGTEHTHGMSSSLLSNIANRSGEIARDIARDRATATTRDR